MSSQPSSLPKMRDTRSRRGTSRSSRVISRISPAITAISTILASLAILALTALVIVAVASPHSPALFRATPLVVSAVFAVHVISVFVDQELFDFRSAFVSGAVALVCNVVVLWNELTRWSRSSSLGGGGGGLTPLEAIIKLQYGSMLAVLPIFVLIITLFVIVDYVLLFFWYAERREQLIAIALLKRRNAVRSFETDRQILREREREIAKRRSQLRGASARNSDRSAVMGIAVAQIVILVVAVILALLYSDAGSFYRGVYLIPVAMAAAAEYAFFGTTPRYWTTVSLIFAVFGLASSVFGAILELQRFFRCVLTTFVPANVVDSSICTDESWLGYFVPWALAVLAVLSVVQVVLLVRLLVTRRDAVRLRN